MDHKEFDQLIARLAQAGSRRDAVKGLVGGTLATVGASSVADAKKGKAKGKGKGKDKKKKEKCKGKGKDPVTICHKGQTIVVSRCALKGHLKHGDFEGPCFSS